MHAFTDEDRIIMAGLKRKKLTVQQIAKAMGIPVEEIIEQENKEMEAAAMDSCAERPQPVTMDALQLVLVDFCKSYEALGEQLVFFSNMISQAATTDQLIAAFPPHPAATSLITALHERYILIPRPIIVPHSPPPPPNISTT